MANIKKVNNKLRGSVKPRTLNQVREYQARTGIKESALVRVAVEEYMSKVYNNANIKNRL
jgi:hypothetical protein